MALDIGKLLKQEAYACIETSIGELCVFSLNIEINGTGFNFDQFTLSLQKSELRNFRKITTLR